MRRLACAKTSVIVRSRLTVSMDAQMPAARDMLLLSESQTPLPQRLLLLSDKYRWASSRLHVSAAMLSVLIEAVRVCRRGDSRPIASTMAARLARAVIPPLVPHQGGLEIALVLLALEGPGCASMTSWLPELCVERAQCRHRSATKVPTTASATSASKSCLPTMDPCNPAGSSVRASKRPRRLLWQSICFCPNNNPCACLVEVAGCAGHEGHRAHLVAHRQRGIHHSQVAPSGHVSIHHQLLEEPLPRVAVFVGLLLLIQHLPPLVSLLPRRRWLVVLPLHCHLSCHWKLSCQIASAKMKITMQCLPTGNLNWRGQAGGLTRAPPTRSGGALYLPAPHGQCQSGQCSWV